MRNVLWLIVATAWAVFGMTAEARAESFPLMCHGGGAMTAQMGSSGGSSIVIDFEHAPQGYLAAKPGKGQCAWSDRALNDREPSRLLLKDAGSMGGLLMNQIKGGFFSVNAFTNGGLIEITSVNMQGDEVDNDGDVPKKPPSETADATDFSGRWDSRTDEGNRYSLDLEQHGKIVSGTYRSRSGTRGTIDGAIRNGALHFGWRMGRFHGKGKFELSDDGDSFEGSYHRDGGEDDGVWSGTRG